MINLNYKFASNEERHFYNWLLELHDKGYVEWIYSEQKTYLVFDKVYGYNPKQFTLIKDKYYTPDFIFKFSNKAYNLFYYDEKGGFLKKKKPFFYCNNNRGIMYIDVKGAFTRNLSSSVTFPDRQSQMANRYNIYVQKTIPYDLSNKKAKLVVGKP